MKKYFAKFCTLVLVTFVLCCCTSENEELENSTTVPLLQKLNYQKSNVSDSQIKNESPILSEEQKPAVVLESKDSLSDSQKDEEIDNIEPGKITEITAQNLDSAVALTWKDPEDDDLFGIEIEVSSKSVESESRNLTPLSKNSVVYAAGTQYAVFTNLTNDIQYTFTLTAIDTSGNRGISTNKRITPKIIAGHPLKINCSKSTEEITEAPVEIRVDVESENLIKSIKYGIGERRIEYFGNSGTKITDTKTFSVSENGLYTVFAQDYAGRREIVLIEVKNIKNTVSEQSPLTDNQAQQVQQIQQDQQVQQELSASDENQESDNIQPPENDDNIAPPVYPEETEEINDNIPNYNTGDLVLSEGKLEGIVFHVAENGIPLCVNVTYFENLQWAANGTVCSTAKIQEITTKITNPGNFNEICFSGDSDGSDNFSALETTDAEGCRNPEMNYPIFGAALNSGDGWYVPSAEEIFILYCEKDRINAILEEHNEMLLFENGHWWTSSQGANKDTAFYLNLDSNRFSDGKKTIPRKCCLIKKLKANYNSTQP